LVTAYTVSRLVTPLAVWVRVRVIRAASLACGNRIPVLIETTCSLGRLDADAAERALVEPALGLQVHWDTDAAELAVHEAGGSPYLIQLIGEESWMQARLEAGTKHRSGARRGGSGGSRREPGQRHVL